MNLKSRKARLPIAVLGACALVTGGGVLAAGTAFAAPTALTLNTGGDSPTVGNFDYTTGAAAANAAYALKVSGSDGMVALALESSPTAAANLAFQRVGSNGAATTAFATASRPTSATNEVQTITPGAGQTYTLTFMGATTAALADAASAATVQAALEGLSTIGAGNVTVTGAGATRVVTFTGGLAATDVPAIVVAQIGGSTTAIAQTTAGVGSHGLLGGTALTSSDYVYVTGDVPGQYKFRLYQDANQTGTYESADERSSALITLTVYDTRNNTSGVASDDVTPVIAATTPILKGVAFTPTITYDKSLSAADARGDTATGLAARIAALTSIDVDPGTSGASPVLTTATTTASYSTSTDKTSFPTVTTSAAGTVVLGADFAAGSSGSTNRSTRSIDVQSNNVTGVALTATDVDGKVKSSTTSGVTSVSVKKTQGAVTYRAKVTASPATDIGGKTVYFTLAGTDFTAGKLTSTGTVVDATGGVYSATTDSDGYASITVTDTATTLASYTVQASSNLIYADADTNSACSSGGGGCQALGVSYANNGLSALSVTSTSTDLTQPTTATSVTIKGKLTDTFGAAYQPGSSDPANVTVTIGSTTSTTPVSADGTFSYTYTPSATPVAGSTTSVTFGYTPAGGTLKTDVATIQWSSSTPAASLTISSPTSSATPTLLTDTPPTGVAITGTVLDSGSSTLAFKPVTLSGDGVYFSTVASPTASSSTDDLTKTFTTTTNASGTYTAYAFYTKPGAIKITASSGSTVTKDVTVTVSQPLATNAYAVTLYDAKVKPGKAVTVTGKVTDVFGNGVPSKLVNLTLSSAALGALSGSTATTTADGTFSQTFTAASDANGVATITAQLDGQVANKTADAVYLANDGLKLADGVYKDTATVTAKDLPLTIASSEQLSYGSKYYARGALVHGSGADALATVDVYSKLPGGSYALIDTVKANANGDWSATEQISKSTYFLAKTGGASTTAAATHIISGVILTGKSGSKGHVTLSANGGPNAKAYLYFYRVFSNGDTDYLGKKLSSSSGNGEATFKAPKGSRKYKVLFKAPGTTTGTDTVSVKVK